MNINNLEIGVIEYLLSDRDLKLIKRSVDFDAISVIDRDFTGVGFYTELEQSNETKLCDDSVSLRWGKVGARLNDSKTETGYLLYIENGYLTTIEGYTYGDEWPLQIETLELYELKLGTDPPQPVASNGMLLE